MRKNNPKLRFLLAPVILLIAMVLINACRKQNESFSIITASLSIENAKNYFSTIVVAKEKQKLSVPYSTLSKRSETRRFARMGKLNTLLQWDKARVNTENGFDFVVVPVDQTRKPFKNKHFEALRNLIFYKDILGQIQVSIMEVISKKDEAITVDGQKIGKIAFSNMYFHKSLPIDLANISVLFYDIDYAFQSSYSVTNGIWSVSKYILKNTSQLYLNKTIKTNSLNDRISSPLSTIGLLSTCQSCTEYALIGTLYDVNSGAILFQETLDIWSECVETDPNGNIIVTIYPYGPEPDPIFSKADHKLPNQNRLPKDGTSNTQVGSMCAYKVIEWVSKFFGGSVTAGNALLWFAQTANLTLAELIASVTTNGINSSDLTTVIGNYFNFASVTTASEIRSAIDAGHPVMAFLLVPGGGHEVMITGWNDDQTFEYFDPQTGFYVNVAVSELNNPQEIISSK